MTLVALLAALALLSALGLIACGAVAMLVYLRSYEAIHNGGAR